MNAYLSKLIMYHEIHRMSQEGFSISKICRELVLDWRTVRNYLFMSEADFDSFVAAQGERRKTLVAYEGFVKAKLLLRKHPTHPVLEFTDYALPNSEAVIHRVDSR